MNQIKMNSVSSSQIKSVGYDESTRELYIEFINGIVYEYHNIPPEIFNTFLVPTISVGSYFQKEIKHNPAILYAKIPCHVENGKLICP